MRHLINNSKKSLVMKSLVPTPIALALVGIQSVANAAALEEVVVTAQKREVGLQDSPISIAAFSGETLKENSIGDATDLARGVAGLSFTQSGPIDMQLNIRGITNTRVDAPTADMSIGMFADDVYVGRTGLLSPNFYDLERVEVIRGPQGVLLGKNVVGGAISIFSKKPDFDGTSAEITLGAGNYGLKTADGFINASLSDDLAVRLSFQSKDRDGYAEDVFHNRDLEDLDSKQIRGQMLYSNDELDLDTRLIVEYTEDSTNGLNHHALADPNGAPNGLGQWSNLTKALGLDERESAPDTIVYENGNFLPETEREATSIILNIDKGVTDAIQLTSITGYRGGDGLSRVSQTGMGYEAEMALRPGADVITDSLIPFIEPIEEVEDIEQFSQELRLTSTSDGPLDWIAGVYYQKDEVEKNDRFVATNKYSSPLYRDTPLYEVIALLSGESHWDNESENTSMAAYAQVGYQFNESWKASIGGRYTRDEKEGTMHGFALSTLDRYSDPQSTDMLPATPLVSLDYTADYGEEWSEFTPQARVEYTPTENILMYLSASKGYKGGGFEDTAPNQVAAETPFDPELVTSFEYGIKFDSDGGRFRANAAIFSMDYEDLQVSQTKNSCLCNTTENASDALIKGIELEITYLPIDPLMTWLSASFLDTEYQDYTESNGTVNDGNDLQRTPNSQYSVGFEYTASLGGWGEALKLRMNYAWQDSLYWNPSNANEEDDYGLLDARVSLAPEGANWSASVWGKNLTDELARTEVIAIFADEVSIFIPPRTYGFEFKYSF